MWHLLKRHPFPVAAHFDFTLALTFAVPADSVRHLIYPGLELDLYQEDTAFLAVAMVQTRRLRPALFPPLLGQDFFLTGYRLFVRYRTPKGRRLRGLQVLRSDTDRALMCTLGNAMTHYRYHHAQAKVNRSGDDLQIDLASCDGQADLAIRANLQPASLPSTSVFPDEKTARRFAGPMPYTFSHEPETHSLIRIEGVRSRWRPRMISAQVHRLDFLTHLGLADKARLANAFYVENIPYLWDKGIVDKLPEPTIPNRTASEGVGNIMRFNWPAYTSAAATVALGSLLATNRRAPGWLRLLGGAAALGAGAQTLSSLAASHWIYDRSRLYDLDWLTRLWPSQPQRILNVHAGFDETTVLLRKLFPAAGIQVLDFFDPVRNPEPSIARARRQHPPTEGTISVGPSGWPMADQSVDAILVFLAAHEMRAAEDRAELFAELRRVTAPGGRIVIVEHLRNAANFAAFGPGFLHFLPRSVWTEETMPFLHLCHEESHTPFLRIFCFEP